MSKALGRGAMINGPSWFRRTTLPMNEQTLAAPNRLVLLPDQLHEFLPLLLFQPAERRLATADRFERDAAV